MIEKKKNHVLFYHPLYFSFFASKICNSFCTPDQPEEATKQKKDITKAYQILINEILSSRQLMKASIFLLLDKFQNYPLKNGRLPAKLPLIKNLLTLIATACPEVL